MGALSGEWQLEVKGVPLGAAGTRMLADYDESIQLPTLEKRQRIAVPEHFVDFRMPETTINK